MLKNTLITALILVITITFQINAANGTCIVSGKVTDSDGKPVIGANVYFSATTFGSAADVDGKYQISGITPGAYTIFVSAIGFEKIEKEIILTLNNKYDFNFTLRPALLEMGSVVVTGTSTPHLYENVPVKTEIIPACLIEQKKSVNLAGALSLQTGVSVENECNNCNFTQVRILGFDGKYTQILIDGDPVISSLGGVYGLEHYPSEMISQIEIVKGGGSALYGAGAIAGTVNLRTRRPSFNNSRVSYLINSVDGNTDQQIGAVAEIVNNNSTSGVFVFGSTREREAYDRNGDGLTELGKLNNETIGFNFFNRPMQNGELTISFHRIHEERRGGGGLDRPIHEAPIGEWTEHLKWGGKLKWEHSVYKKFDYNAHYSFSFLTRDSYYGGLPDNSDEARLKALNSYGYSKNPLHVAGLQGNFYAGFHTISAGMQFFYDKLEDKSVSTSDYNIDQNTTNFGIFIQDEFKFDEHGDITLVSGLRIDKHSEINTPILSPRINLKFSITHEIQLRAGYTSGFKAPQIFNEDLHICGLEGTQRVIRNSNNLKEERSHSFNLGAEYQGFIGNMALLFGVTGFYSRLNGAYSEEFVEATDTFELWKRVNSEGAYVGGIELDFGIKPVNNIEVRSGVIIKSNKYDNKIDDFSTHEFLRTSNYSGYVRTSYNPLELLNLFVAASFNGPQYVPHEKVAPDSEDPVFELHRSETFVILDLGMSYKIPMFESFGGALSVGIRNLGDVYQKDLDYGNERDPGYIYGPSQPRTYYMGFQSNF